MDQRSSLRKLINLETALYYQGLLITKSQTKDISLEGMCLLCPVSLPLHAMIKVTVSFDDITQNCTLPGIVMHNSGNGLGLKYFNYKCKAYQAMHHLLDGYVTDVAAQPEISWPH